MGLAYLQTVLQVNWLTNRSVGGQVGTASMALFLRWRPAINNQVFNILCLTFSANSRFSLSVHLHFLSIFSCFFQLMTPSDLSHSSSVRDTVTAFSAGAPAS